ncbi:hypothetical protein K2D_45080 [Planctomycetes bacterium K2D]|uniref:Uncharacterized protein n=1 Tax=Botrimarina mediterranea TaxID=2528022 RepID=A0A518KEQ2_9BACT|nr:hypothetical protein Spa11_45050 [Botrimarina mediterranea]QDV80873.1 hypothetical protein K2D_45080 [Planctomycetes bacterium K2D]
MIVSSVDNQYRCSNHFPIDTRLKRISVCCSYLDDEICIDSYFYLLPPITRCNYLTFLGSIPTIQLAARDRYGFSLSVLLDVMPFLNYEA